MTPRTTRIYRCGDCEPGLIVSEDPGKIARWLQRHGGHDIDRQLHDDPLEGRRGSA